MHSDFKDLAAYGWSHAFQSQLTENDSGGTPMRVVAVHRSGLDLAGPNGALTVPPLTVDDDEDQATVGDWLIVDLERGAMRRRLDRTSLFKRRASGTARRTQLIAANVDTLLIVTSCNHDFNVARLERYLALAHEASVTPVVVLTKADLAEEPENYGDKARRLMPGLLVECLDALNPAAVSTALWPWCGFGQTVALVGSSGVGKSTLVNTLAGAGQETRGIREDDGRGRHTTTRRSLHRLNGGGWLIDTPGMRELQLTDAAEGIAEVFDDITTLARSCRFSDCRHDTEPDCAVRAAIAAGVLDAARFERYGKLAREDRRNAEALHERRARDRAFGRMTRAIMKAKER